MRTLIWIIVLAAIAGAGGFAVFEYREKEAQQKAAAPAPEPATVKVITVKPSDMTEVYVTYGSLLAEHEVDITPEESGVITKLFFEDGAEVKAGDEIAQLNDEVYRAEYASAKTDLEVKKDAYERAKKLVKGGYQSQATVDTKRSDYASAQSNLAVWEAQLGRRTVRAPFSGQLGRREKDVGSYVRSGDSIVKLRDLSTLRVEMFAPERYINKLKLGTPFTASSDAVPNLVIDGKITFVSPSLDAKTRSLKLEGRVDNPDGRLSPGLFVRARLEVAKHPDVLSVPERAILASLAGDYVYRVKDGEAERVEVTSGLRQDGRVYVLQGLAAGDQIVSTGMQKLTDGAAVKVVGEEAG